MAGWLLVALSLVSALPASSRVDPGAPAELDDGSSLVQVKVVAGGAATKGNPAESWTRVQVQTYSFPLEVHNHHFVGSAAFMLMWLERRIHFYDIALYLNSSSSLWDGLHRNHTKDVEQMLGQTQFYIAMHSRMVSRRALAALVDGLALFADLRKIANYTTVLDEYKRCYKNGPRITAGSVLVLEPDQNGLTCKLNDLPLCRVDSSYLGLLVMDQYLGRRSDFPELRNNAFSQLAEGKPSEVRLPVVISVEAAVPWWVTAILVLLGVAGCAGLLYIYHTCCRVSYDGEAGAADTAS